MKSFSHFILRRAGWIALLGTLLALVGTYFTAHLFMNLRTGFEELLPREARSVVNLDEVSHRLRSIDNIGILIFSEDTNASKRFVIDLADRLKKLPPRLVSSVEFEISRELKFFKDRQALYMDLPDLLKIRNYVASRIEYEKGLYNPLNIFSGVDIPEPKLDLTALKARYKQGLSTYERFPGGFYATPDEKKRVILVYTASGDSSIDRNMELKKAIVNEIARLNPATYAKDLEIKYTGGIQDTIEEQEALVEDLVKSTLIVVALVTLAMIFFFRNIRATIALVTSLFGGTLWTFGISYFAVGYLNANSAFLGSIVIGNGINFGIIVLARYLEERRKGRLNSRAIRITLGATATPTFTAALGAALSYGSLMITSFRGFRQFGVIGLIGMSLCWISAFTLLPAYLTLFDKIYPLVRRRSREGRHVLASSLAAVVGFMPRSLWYGSLAITGLSLVMIGRYSSGILETDLSQLRNRHSLESGSAYLSKYLDEIFQRYLSPMAILPRSRDEALKIAARLREKKAREGAASLISSIQTLDDFIPKYQPEKIHVLRQIKALIPPKIFYRLSVEDQRKATDLLNPAGFKPIEMTDLPKLLLDKFSEKDGTVGKLVLVEPPLAASHWTADQLSGFVQELRDATDSVAPGAPVAGSITITADMIQAIARDGPRATAFAFGAVTTLVIILFHNLATIALILFSLVLGVIWLAGFILGFWVKINFLNFIALPITFGIGVDYGVNMFERYRHEGPGNILKVVRNTGGAVLLCSFTTIVGYVSLLIASNKAFVSFGLLAVAGEVTCVTAAVVSLPAYLLLRNRRQMRRRSRLQPPQPAPAPPPGLHAP